MCTERHFFAFPRRYHCAGGLLCAQEAEALRAAQLSYFEASTQALLKVPLYGPAELTRDLTGPFHLYCCK
jgi:hypothetical protein